MKKFFALTLALVMFMSMATMAAAEVITDNGTGLTNLNDYATKNVEVTVSTASTVFYVVVTWEDLSFEYISTWNPQTHTYDKSWGDDDNTEVIYVENHSNADVQCTFSAGLDEDDGFDVTFNNTTVTLNSADNDQYRSGDADSDGYCDGDKQSVTMTVAVDNNEPAPAVGSHTVGTITVTITPYTP